MSESEKRDTIALVLHGLLKNIDTTPSKSWIFEDLGDGQTFLHKYIERVEALDFVHCIYIATLDSEEHRKFLKYSSEFVKVVYLKEDDFFWPKNWWGMTWNLSNLSESTIAVWAYQIMLGFNEPYLLEDPVFGGFWCPEIVNKAFHMVQENPGHYGSVQGNFSIECLITSQEYYQKVFEGVLLGKPKSADKLGKDSPVIRLYSNREDQKYNFELDEIFRIHPNRKQGYEFIKGFFHEHPRMMTQADFKRAIEVYCAKNYTEHFSKIPETVLIQVKRDQEELELSTVLNLLSQLQDLARFTVIFEENLREHSQFVDILNQLSNFNCHYYWKTDGEFPQTLLNQVMETIDVLCFTILNPDAQTFQAMAPDRNVQLCLKNMFDCMMSVSNRGFPQVGIECRLPEDDSKKFEIIKFWRERLDHVDPLNYAYKMQGHLSPRVQFVRYLSPNHLEEEIEKDIDFKQLKIDVRGNFNDSDQNIQSITIREYLGLDSN